jgi:hypothetical protein
MLQQKLVNDKTAATYMDLATQTLRNWRFLGKGPKYVRLGDRCIRYRLDDLDRWLNDRTIDTEAA